MRIETNTGITYLINLERIAFIDIHNKSDESPADKLNIHFTSGDVVSLTDTAIKDNTCTYIGAQFQNYLKMVHNS
ncbi:MAG: hypothetical protein MUE56_03000 [Ignavibacteria bacterium]|nr:hypothetical protein [Ignavibacteria bacterium]